MKLSRLIADSDKARNGVPFEHEGTTFIVAKAANVNFIKRCQELLANYPGTVTVEQELEVNARAMSEHVLLGWENLKDDEGNNIEYSQELAFEILRNPEAVDFRELIKRFAERSSAFLADKKEKRKKKSATTSDGT